jgi:hypothetical protein
MIFDDLIGRPFTETELVEQICLRLQARYSVYQQEYFFICLKRVNETESAIQCLKVFPTDKAWYEFFYDTEFQRAMIHIKFLEGRYEIGLLGFQFFAEWILYPDQIEEKMFYKASYNPEEMPMMSKEEVQGYINQFKDALRNPQKRKVS